MDRGFQSLLLAGKYDIADGNFPPLITSDEQYISRETSSQTSSYAKTVPLPLLPLLNYPYCSVYSIPEVGNVQREKMSVSSKEFSVEMEEKLKRLKTEQTEVFRFNPTIVYGQLPELQSIEQVNREERCLNQKFSSIGTGSNQRVFESMLTRFQMEANYFTPAPVQVQPLRPYLPPPSKLSRREQAYRKRHTLSDKTRSLQKLLPWEKKMDMATIYEETFKYIRFLKAQIAVLESMPVSSTFPSSFGSEQNPRYGTNMYGGLGKLNRQQLLEVLVNSPAAQSILYTKGCCIYSLEQLISFNHIAEKSFISDH